MKMHESVFWVEELQKNTSHRPQKELEEALEEAKSKYDFVANEIARKMAFLLNASRSKKEIKV